MCYPWKVRYGDLHAGCAWFKAFAIAALEIDGFLGEEEVEDPDERARRIKEVIRRVVVGQDTGLNFAFDVATKILQTRRRCE